MPYKNEDYSPCNAFTTSKQITLFINVICIWLEHDEYKTTVRFSHSMQDFITRSMNLEHKDQ